jgi:hypothetical protein
MRVKLNEAMNRAAMWSGHYVLQIIAVCLVLSVIAGVAADLGVLTGWPAEASDLVTFVPMVYAALNRNFHERNAVLCNRHFHETPDDPAEAVRQARWALRMTHKINRPWLVVPLVIVALLVQDLLKRVLHQPALVSSLPVGVAFIGMSGMCWVGSVHERLQPWCPFCRRGGGGEDRTVVPTDPTGSRLPSPA